MNNVTAAFLVRFFMNFVPSIRPGAVPFPVREVRQPLSGFSGSTELRGRPFGMHEANCLVEQPWHRLAHAAVRISRLTLLIGLPGAGKSHLAWHLARRLTGQDPQFLQGNPTTDLLHLWGHPTISALETGFVDGPLACALKNNQVLIVDDFGLIPIEVRAELLKLRSGQSVAHNPYSKERLKIRANFRLIATSNPESLRCRGARAEGLRALLSDFLILVAPPLNSQAILEILRQEVAPSRTEFSAESPIDDSLRQTVVPDCAQIERAMHHFDAISRAVDEECQDNSVKVMLTIRSARHLAALLALNVPESQAVETALINQFVLDEDVHEALKLRQLVVEE